MLLGVNIDHIATLRNARGGLEPNLIQAALLCEKAGADGITVHLREDRRHTKDNDVSELKHILKTRLNLEMAVTDEMQKIALEVLPSNCCLVPEKRQEVTTEGGLDVAGQFEKIRDFVKPLKDAGIIVSLFIDADKNQVEAAYKTGAQFIELHTGKYSEAYGTNSEDYELNNLKIAAELAQNLGLKVNAGHGLTYENVHRMKEINGLLELNIGHNIIARAVFDGLEKAVKDMIDLIK
ncbi:MAG: pyridoxine 5'-phosphate synthase [Clostridium sp.]|nr:pyridoxine 5'-phosphate synthase [Clostridium sp.]